MNKSPIISVENYSHYFGKRRVIDDLSFKIYQGDVFGFLGANGSGKTTTIRTLLGIYRPNTGQLHIKGREYTPSSPISLGYLPEERGLYKKESVIDTMVYFGQLKNMSRQNARQWSLHYLERVELADKAEVRLDKLSGGQQQKIQLGVTIMNQPDLLILDEPTKGFDPVNRRLMMDIVQEMQHHGTTVVLVTHQMEEVERLCNRVMLLKDGKRRLYGTTSEVKQEYSTDLIQLQFSGTLSPNNQLYTIQNRTQRSAELLIKDNVTSQAIFQALATQPKLKVERFELSQTSLDDIFVQIYGQSGAKPHA